MNTDFSTFKSRHVVSKQFGKFTEKEIASIKGKLPEEVIIFLKQEGRSTFSNDFLWTVLPGDLEFSDMFEQWELPGKECYVFLRTALGVCIYYYQGNYYYFNPLKGINGQMFEDFNFVINTYLIMDVFIVDNFGYDHFIRLSKGKPQLKFDEMYGLFPALPLGGSYDTSILEIVKMYEHMVFLAELFGNKVKQI